MASLKKTIKNLFFFSEPEKVEGFILKENEGNGKNLEDNESNNDREKQKPKGGQEEDERPRKKKNEGLLLKKVSPAGSNNEKENEKEKESDGDSEISTKLSDNLKYMKKVYTIPTNGDVVIREFKITFKCKPVEAFIIFIDGMTDRMVINTNILQPLMLLSNLDIKDDEKELGEYIKDRLLPHNQLKMVNKYEDVIKEINFGGCGLFVDGVDVAFAADVKGWEHRGIERPNTELVIRGPQEGFSEVLRINTALVRKILKDEDLIVENVTVGRRSKTPCAILFIKDITNDSLVAEVRRRIKSIKVDYLLDSGELEQYIEESTFLPTPQIIATERPDRVAHYLVQGRVAVIVHGSPFALVIPITGNDLIHSSEDIYSRFPYAILLRFFRILGVFMSLLLPGLYVAITNYHQEMIPTDLIFAIAASRERVPFPSVVEILIMEFSFELIREAGIRIPGPIGPTLGIIGALILGQAAVAANIVSPILIIIVAVTGIGSFAIPSFSLAFALRVMRFVFIILGALAGFLGITTGVFLMGIAFCAAKSFGVPFMVPFGPRTAGSFADKIIRAPIWKQETRDDFTNPKDIRRQSEISRGWVKKKPGEDDKGGK